MFVSAFWVYQYKTAYGQEQHKVLLELVTREIGN
jgi:hypothetical protein